MGNSPSSRRKECSLDFDKSNIPNYKIILIGDPAVGKSSVFLRYAKNQYDYSYRPTQRAVIENIVKKVNLPGSIVTSVTLWDLPGSEDMDLRTSYYRNVDAVIVVVDMTDMESIQLAGSWKADFINRATKVRLVKEKLPSGLFVTEMEELPFDPNKVPILLLGNKYDLVDEEQQTQKFQDILIEPGINIDDEENVEEMKNEMTVPQNKGKGKGKGKKSKNMEEEIDFDESNEGTEDVSDERVACFTPQRGPEPGDDKPECVKLLEKVEKEFGFVGSIMVSAKDNDESVHSGIQSLVRYLLEKSGILKPKITKDLINKKQRKKVIQKDNFVSLERVNIPEYDRIFERCEIPLRRAGEYLAFYDLALKKFKQTCADYDFLKESKASLEDCIVGIKEFLQEEVHVNLESEDDEDGFLHLYHDVNPRFKVPRSVPAALEVFHKEYAAMCKVILRDCPGMDTLLMKFDNKIKNKSEKVWELLVDKKGNNIDSVLHTCDQNRARIAHARLQVAECLDNVENAHKKIKTSLMW